MKRILQILLKFIGRPSCQEVNRFLAEYIEGTLPDEVRVKFDRHLSHCKCCGPFLDNYRSTIKFANSSQDIVIPEKLADSTIEFLRSHLKDA